MCFTAQADGTHQSSPHRAMTGADYFAYCSGTPWHGSSEVLARGVDHSHRASHLGGRVSISTKYRMVRVQLRSKFVENQTSMLAMFTLTDNQCGWLTSAIFLVRV